MASGRLLLDQKAEFFVFNRKMITGFPGLPVFPNTFQLQRVGFAC
jgi:hypothetical protein